MCQPKRFESVCNDAHFIVWSSSHDRVRVIQRSPVRVAYNCISSGSCGVSFLNVLTCYNQLIVFIDCQHSPSPSSPSSPAPAPHSSMSLSARPRWRWSWTALQLGRRRSVRRGTSPRMAWRSWAVRSAQGAGGTTRPRSVLVLNPEGPIWVGWRWLQRRQRPIGWC